MRFYLSGPMTGLPENNYPAFHDAHRALRAAGYSVVNPAAGAPCGLTYDQYLRRALRLLLDCQAIVMLSGWEGSRGARIEAKLAASLGMPWHHVDELIASRR
jgi:hypothetical protein